MFELVWIDNFEQAAFEKEPGKSLELINCAGFVGVFFKQNRTEHTLGVDDISEDCTPQKKQNMHICLRG